MVRYLFYTIGDLTYQSPLVHLGVWCTVAFDAWWWWFDSVICNEGSSLLHVLRSQTWVPDYSLSKGTLLHTIFEFQVYLRLLLGTCCSRADGPSTVAYPGIFFGGGLNKFSWGQDRKDGDLGGGSPLVRGSEGSCNLVQEISFHIVKFS